MAWRNLVSHKNRHGLSFMTIVSILGVAVGVSALIIVLSVMGGFEQELKAKMLKGQPHLEILGQNALAGFSLKKHTLDDIAAMAPKATGVEAFTQADVVLKQGKHLSAAVLFGVDPEKNGHLWGFGGAMVEGKLSDIGSNHLPLLTKGEVNAKWPGIALGESLAAQLGADIGDEITVISPSATSASSALAGGTVTRQYVLSGLFRTGLFNFDSKWAVVSTHEGRKFMADYDSSLEEEEYVTGIAVNVENPYDIEAVAQKVIKASGLAAKTWMDSNAALLFALKLEKFTMGSILMLIVLVAAFSISGTMMMTVFHKSRQVSLLRSLGMTRGGVVRLFLWQGMAIGLVGIVIGFIFGLAVCILLDKFRFEGIPTNLLYIRALPVKFLPLDYAVIGLFAWVLSLIGAIYPAIIASRQNSSSGLRY